MAINKVVYDGNTLIDLTGDTVTTADVLDGVSFHLSDGYQLTGTMPDRGAITLELSAGQSFSIPYGYHNGGGVISASASGGSSPQTGTMKSGTTTSRTVTISGLTQGSYYAFAVSCIFNPSSYSSNTISQAGVDALAFNQGQVSGTFANTSIRVRNAILIGKATDTSVSITQQRSGPMHVYCIPLSGDFGELNESSSTNDFEPIEETI